MKKLRKQFNLFCFRNRDKGIPNLMLYIVLGTAVVYVMSDILGNPLLYSLLYFDRTLILQGQVWRLLTYPLTYRVGNLLLMAVSLFCYYSIGRAMENVWGTLRFNLFYLTGIVMMDIYCMLFGGSASVAYLNTSLFLGYATMYPDATFLLMFIIPVKAWIFALLDLVIVLMNLLFYPFPYNLFAVISLANYFLFFGEEVLNVIPMKWRRKLMGLFRKNRKPQGPTVIPFRPQASQSAPHPQKAAYTHRCTVCGRTDVSDPDLEFRYCSRCKGYYCYCQDHINNHTHIQ